MKKGVIFLLAALFLNAAPSVIQAQELKSPLKATKFATKGLFPHFQSQQENRSTKNTMADKQALLNDLKMAKDEDSKSSVFATIPSVKINPDTGSIEINVNSGSGPSVKIDSNSGSTGINVNSGSGSSVKIDSNSGSININVNNGSGPSVKVDPNSGSIETNPGTGSDSSNGTNSNNGSDPGNGTNPNNGSDPSNGTNPSNGSDPSNGTNDGTQSGGNSQTDIHSGNGGSSENEGNSGAEDQSGAVPVTDNSHIGDFSTPDLSWQASEPGTEDLLPGNALVLKNAGPPSLSKAGADKALASKLIGSLLDNGNQTAFISADRNQQNEYQTDNSKNGNGTAKDNVRQLENVVVPSTSNSGGSGSANGSAGPSSSGGAGVYAVLGSGYHDEKGLKSQLQFFLKKLADKWIKIPPTEPPQAAFFLLV